MYVILPHSSPGLAPSQTSPQVPGLASETNYHVRLAVAERAAQSERQVRAAGPLSMINALLVQIHTGHDSRNCQIRTTRV